jgi:hypothetical protein
VQKHGQTGDLCEHVHGAHHCVHIIIIGSLALEWLLRQLSFGLESIVGQVEDEDEDDSEISRRGLLDVIERSERRI